VISRRTVWACEEGDSSAERGSRSLDSRARTPVRFATSAYGHCGDRHEHAAAARMKGRHRIELGSHFARIERLARRAGQAHVLALDPSSEPLTGEVRVHGGPVGEHIAPLDEQSEFAEPICLRVRPMRRRDLVQTLPSSRKDAGGGKGGLPTIEVRPREIWSTGCHRSLIDQSRRTAATPADAAVMRRISIADGSPGGEAAAARSAGGAPRF
jgi:hypothetical protein